MKNEKGMSAGTKSVRYSELGGRGRKEKKECIRGKKKKKGTGGREDGWGSV